MRIVDIYGRWKYCIERSRQVCWVDTALYQEIHLIWSKSVKSRRASISDPNTLISVIWGAHQKFSTSWYHHGVWGIRFGVIGCYRIRAYNCWKLNFASLRPPMNKFTTTKQRRQMYQERVVRLYHELRALDFR